MLTLISTIIFVAALFIIYFVLFKKEQKAQISKEDLDRIEKRFSDTTNLILNQLNDRLRENRESLERNQAQVASNIHSFTSGITQMKEALKQVQDHVKEVASFQEIFKSPKLRGRWGEESLEHILSQYFSQDQYQLQYSFKKSMEKADAVLNLPNGRILAIDAKFPFENFEKMIESQNEIEKLAFQKLFIQDVKNMIDDIAQKYIAPSEGTIDYALMYVPAEAVYYEIMNNLKATYDLTEYARSKRVIVVSPNTFFISIQAILHWFKDVQFSKQSQVIRQRLERVIQDAQKLEENFRKLDKHLNDARSSFEDSDKRLSLMTDRVSRIIEPEEEKSLGPPSQKNLV